MKQKISITIEEDLVAKLDEVMQDNSFRNKSHLIEMAITRFVEDIEDEVR